MRVNRCRQLGDLARRFVIACEQDHASYERMPEPRFILRRQRLAQHVQHYRPQSHVFPLSSQSGDYTFIDPFFILGDDAGPPR